MKGKALRFIHQPKVLSPGPWFSCTYSGAGNPSKKTLIFAQNLENKGAEIFLPPRSMVLKVVTGKILETLELSRGLTVPGFCFGTRESVVRIVKERTLSHR